MHKSGKILLVMLKGSHCTISRALTSNRKLKRCFRGNEFGAERIIWRFVEIVDGVQCKLNWRFHIWNWKLCEKLFPEIESQQTIAGQTLIYFNAQQHFKPNWRYKYFYCWTNTFPHLEEITRSVFRVIWMQFQIWNDWIPPSVVFEPKWSIIARKKLLFFQR